MTQIRDVAYEELSDEEKTLVRWCWKAGIAMEFNNPDHSRTEWMPITDALKDAAKSPDLALPTVHYRLAAR